MMMARPEKRLDLLRACVGGDIEVLRLDAEQQVAHRAAHHIARESRLAQHRSRPWSAAGLRPFACQPVLFARHPQGRFGGQAQHPPDEPLDHAGADSTGALS
jgi:hypothetical protein